MDQFTRPARSLAPSTPLWPQVRHRRMLASACVGVALALICPTGALAQQAGTQPAQPATQPQTQPQGGVQSVTPEQLLKLVEDFYHFATIANYPAANALGQQILASSPDPQALLDAFREVQGRRTEEISDLDRRFLQWQQTEQIGETTRQIVEMVNQGRQQRATDPAFIAEQIERLNKGALAYRNGLAQLRNSGEYAVPVMIQYLRNPEQAEFHADIRRAMIDLGRDMLPPLLAATRMEDERVLASLLLVLGELRYDAAVPFLLEAKETSQSQSVQTAANRALQTIGFTGNSTAAQEFQNLSERIYYGGSAAYQPNARIGLASIWHWGGQAAGLTRTDVPPQIYDEIMAMRTAGKALQLGQGMDEALALWLASNYRREGELPEGEMDRTRPEDDPSAGYYGTQAGVRYLQMVLDRAERDRTLPGDRRYNTADVSLRAIKSLQEIVGRSAIGEGGSPLTNAMNYPDRRVRIEAAMALAQALPTQGFAGQEQVVPLLADALSQTGQPNVLVVMQNRDKLNAASQVLTDAGYSVADATSATEAIEKAQALPGVSVVLLDQGLGDQGIDQFLANARNNPKLNAAAKLVQVGSTASRYEALKETNPTLNTTTATGGEGLIAAIELARQSSGGLPLEPEGATNLASRAGNLLKEIGIGNTIFDLASGEPTILTALDDERAGIQKLAGEVAALLSSSAAQRALLDKALNDDTADDVKISVFNSLATSAKRYGNQLETAQVEELLDVAAGAENLDVRAAAAEAVGALDLPADQVRRLIVEETTTGEAPASN